MKKIIFILFLMLNVSVNAQKDTLKLNATFNVLGRYQSGNLNEIGGAAVARVSLMNSKWYTRVSGSYNYVEIEKYTVMNDFWSSGLLKYQHTKRIYPITMVYAGFAKSFGIDEAYVAGVGAGVNIVQKSASQYLNINLIGGYSTFNYVNVTDVNDLVTNIFISSNTTLFKSKAEINWEFHGFYHPTSTIDITGIQNNIRLALPLSKAIKFTLTHQYLYNSYVDVGISKSNSLLLFGLMIKK